LPIVHPIEAWENKLSCQKQGIAMKLILTIALSAFMLSGCMAEWPSHRTGPRFTSGPGLSPIGASPSNTGGGGEAFGQIHGIGP
jgi:hypothetical protein